VTAQASGQRISPKTNTQGSKSLASWTRSPVPRAIPTTSAAGQQHMLHRVPQAQHYSTFFQCQTATCLSASAGLQQLGQAATAVTSAPVTIISTTPSLAGHMSHGLATAQNSNTHNITSPHLKTTWQSLSHTLKHPAASRVSVCCFRDAHPADSKSKLAQ
jgi:hypothetical protein